MSKKKMTGREGLEEALRGCCSTYCDQYPRYEGEIDLGDDYENYIDYLHDADVYSGAYGPGPYPQGGLYIFRNRQDTGNRS